MKALLHIIYFFTGIGTVLIGPVLPIFARRYSLNDLELSYFFPAQFAGSLLGTFVSSRFARRDNYTAATVIGGLMMVGGILMMNVDSFGACLAGFFVNGIGIGLTLPSINMMIVELNPARSGSALSVVNFCWGLGAIACKPFVDLFSGRDEIGMTTIILAVPLAAASLMLIPASRNVTLPVREITAVSDTEQFPIWRMPMAWAIAFFNFINVGFESGMGGWLTTYTERLDGQPILPWISPTLLYFSFFVIGRGVAPILFRFLDDNKMLFLGLAVVMAGTILVLAAGSVLDLSIGASVAGFGTSWLFPTNVSRFSNTFGPTATRRATPLFICGTLGAVSVTWLIGYFSNRTGDLRSGMYVLAVSVVLLTMLQIALTVKGGHREPQNGKGQM